MTGRETLMLTGVKLTLRRIGKINRWRMKATNRTKFSIFNIKEKKDKV